MIVIMWQIKLKKMLLLILNSVCFYYCNQLHPSLCLMCVCLSVYVCVFHFYNRAKLYPLNLSYIFIHVKVAETNLLLNKWNSSSPVKSLDESLVFKQKITFFYSLCFLTYWPNKSRANKGWKKKWKK